MVHSWARNNVFPATVQDLVARAANFDRFVTNNRPAAYRTDARTARSVGSSPYSSPDMRRAVF